MCSLRMHNHTGSVTTLKFMLTTTANNYLGVERSEVERSEVADVIAVFLDLPCCRAVQYINSVSGDC